MRSTHDLAVLDQGQGGGALPHAPRLLVIANPLAGTGAGRRLLQRTLDVLRAEGCRLLIAEARTPEEIAALAGGTGPEDADAVVAAGGDGTINAAANGLMQRDFPLPLGVLAVGTANVMALEMGLTRAPRALAAPFLNGRLRPVTPIETPSGHALLMVGAGFDGAVVAALAARPALKWRWGKLAYLPPVLDRIRHYDWPEISVRIDGAPHRAHGVVAVNGRLYGGAFRAVPEGDITRPGMHVVLLGGQGVAALLRQGAALAAGRLDRLADVRILPARELVVEGPAGLAIQADGDPLPPAPALLRVADRSLNLIWP
ncbi:diacylglycerol kinase family protein [Tistrella mobilis]|uniref:diacylglycerol/lipid kinase family protein n=1 Tax=Tistrella mobilis TaxID=171437 RepID=UPI00355632B8